MAGIAIRKVTAPEPSKCTIMARIAVPIVIFTGLYPTTFRMKLIIGSNMPASLSTPKNIIANTNIATTGAIFLIPVMAKLAVSVPKPAISAPTIGTTIKADKALTFLDKISANKTIVINIPV